MSRGLNKRVRSALIIMKEYPLKGTEFYTWGTRTQSGRQGHVNEVKGGFTGQSKKKIALAGKKRKKTVLEEKGPDRPREARNWGRPSWRKTASLFTWEENGKEVEIKAKKKKTNRIIRERREGGPACTKKEKKVYSRVSTTRPAEYSIVEMDETQKKRGDPLPGGKAESYVKAEDQRTIESRDKG